MVFISKRFKSTNPSLHKAVIQSCSFLIYVHTLEPIYTNTKSCIIYRSRYSIQLCKLISKMDISHYHGEKVIFSQLIFKKCCITKSHTFIRNEYSTKMK